MPTSTGFRIAGILLGALSVGLMLFLFFAPVKAQAAVIYSYTADHSTAANPTAEFVNSSGATSVGIVELKVWNVANTWATGDSGSPNFTPGQIRWGIRTVNSATNNPLDFEVCSKLFDVSGWPTTDNASVFLDFSDTTCDITNGTYYVVPTTQAYSARGYLKGNAAQTQTYVIVNNAGPEPPTTDFNEVIDYIYDPNLDNSFGTSTVGALFSIPEPTYIDSIGVELRDPNGTVVWNDTLSPTTAGTYSISDDYNFDVSGAYELTAYFIQEGVKINNTVGLFILINTPVWTTDPVTGDFVPQASTTIATSTLDNYKLTCPDDLLVGGICKLALGLFFPKTTSIQGVQASFNALMTKAPFSFFTQSKAVLDAFKTVGEGTPATYSVTYNDVTSPFISPEILATIGLNEERLDYIKFVIRVALWILLAWYFYTRIASIFGV